MSATKPPPGYDDRFVVPLEPSRRGAHRARVSPLIGALPVVAVVAVVVVVVMLAWTLFGHSTGSSDTGSTAAGTGSATRPAQTVPASGSTVSTPATTQATATATGSTATSTAAGTADHAVSITVLNSTTRTGLASRVSTLLTGKGWTASHFAKTPKVAAQPTTVYYATTKQKASAEAIVADLGVGVVHKSTQFGTAGITVVVGTDYP